MPRKEWTQVEVPVGWTHLIRGPRPKSEQWARAVRNQSAAVGREPQPGVQPCVQRVQRGRWREHGQSRQNPDVSIDVAKKRVRSLEAALAVLEEEGDTGSPEVRTLQRSLVQAKRAAQELPVGVQLTQARCSWRGRGNVWPNTTSSVWCQQQTCRRRGPFGETLSPRVERSTYSASITRCTTMEDERDPATCQATVKRQATTSTRSAPRRDIPPILPTLVPAELGSCETIREFHS